MSFGMIQRSAGTRGLTIIAVWLTIVIAITGSTRTPEHNQYKCIALRFLNHAGGNFRIITTMKPEGYLVTTDEYKLKTIFQHSQIRHFVIFHGVDDSRMQDVLLDGEKTISVSPQSDCDHFSDVIVTARKVPTVSKKPTTSSFSETHLPVSTVSAKQPDDSRKASSIREDAKNSASERTDDATKRGNTNDNDDTKQYTETSDDVPTISDEHTIPYSDMAGLYRGENERTQQNDTMALKSLSVHLLTTHDDNDTNLTYVDEDVPENKPSLNFHQRRSDQLRRVAGSGFKSKSQLDKETKMRKTLGKKTFSSGNVIPRNEKLKQNRKREETNILKEMWPLVVDHQSAMNEDRERNNKIYRDIQESISHNKDDKNNNKNNYHYNNYNDNNVNNNKNNNNNNNNYNDKNNEDEMQTALYKKELKTLRPYLLTMKSSGISDASKNKNLNVQNLPVSSVSHYINKVESARDERIGTAINTPPQAEEIQNTDPGNIEQKRISQPSGLNEYHHSTLQHTGLIHKDGRLDIVSVIPSKSTNSGKSENNKPRLIHSKAEAIEEIVNALGTKNRIVKDANGLYLITGKHVKIIHRTHHNKPTRYRENLNRATDAHIARSEGSRSSVYHNSSRRLAPVLQIRKRKPLESFEGFSKSLLHDIKQEVGLPLSTYNLRDLQKKLRQKFVGDRKNQQRNNQSKVSSKTESFVDERNQRKDNENASVLSGGSSHERRKVVHKNVQQVKNKSGGQVSEETNKNRNSKMINVNDKEVNKELKGNRTNTKEIKNDLLENTRDAGKSKNDRYTHQQTGNNVDLRNNSSEKISKFQETKKVLQAFDSSNENTGQGHSLWDNETYLNDSAGSADSLSVTVSRDNLHDVSRDVTDKGSGPINGKSSDVYVEVVDEGKGSDRTKERFTPDKLEQNEDVEIIDEGNNPAIEKESPTLEDISSALYERFGKKNTTPKPLGTVEAPKITDSNEITSFSQHKMETTGSRGSMGSTGTTGSFGIRRRPVTMEQLSTEGSQVTMGSPGASTKEITGSPGIIGVSGMIGTSRVTGTKPTDLPSAPITQTSLTNEPSRVIQLPSNPESELATQSDGETQTQNINQATSLVVMPKINKSLGVNEYGQDRSTSDGASIDDFSSDKLNSDEIILPSSSYTTKSSGRSKSTTGIQSSASTMSNRITELPESTQRVKPDKVLKIPREQKVRKPFEISQNDFKSLEATRSPGNNRFWRPGHVSRTQGSQALVDISQNKGPLLTEDIQNYLSSNKNTEHVTHSEGVTTESKVSPRINANEQNNREQMVPKHVLDDFLSSFIKDFREKTMGRFQITSNGKQEQPSSVTTQNLDNSASEVFSTEHSEKEEAKEEKMNGKSYEKPRKAPVESKLDSLLDHFVEVLHNRLKKMDKQPKHKSKKIYHKILHTEPQMNNANALLKYQEGLLWKQQEKLEHQLAEEQEMLRKKKLPLPANENLYDEFLPDTEKNHDESRPGGKTVPMMNTLKKKIRQLNQEKRILLRKLKMLNSKKHTRLFEGDDNVAKVTKENQESPVTEIYDHLGLESGTAPYMNSRITYKAINSEQPNEETKEHDFSNQESHETHELSNDHEYTTTPDRQLSAGPEHVGLTTDHDHSAATSKELSTVPEHKTVAGEYHSNYEEAEHEVSGRQTENKQPFSELLPSKEERGTFQGYTTDTQRLQKPVSMYKDKTTPDLSSNTPSGPMYPTPPFINKEANYVSNAVKMFGHAIPNEEIPQQRSLRRDSNGFSKPQLGLTQLSVNEPYKPESSNIETSTNQVPQKTASVFPGTYTYVDPTEHPGIPRDLQRRREDAELLKEMPEYAAQDNTIESKSQSGQYAVVTSPEQSNVQIKPQFTNTASSDGAEVEEDDTQEQQEDETEEFQRPTNAKTESNIEVADEGDTPTISRKTDNPEDDLENTLINGDEYHLQKKHSIQKQNKKKV